MSDKKILGGCSCSAFRYEISSGILDAFQCHCRHCQYASGTGHSSLLVVPSGSLLTDGKLKYYDQSSATGNVVSRGFCPYCGTPVSCLTSGNPQVTMLHAATLDNPELFTPTKAVFCESKHSWDYIAPSLKKE